LHEHPADPLQRQRSESRVEIARIAYRFDDELLPLNLCVCPSFVRDFDPADDRLGSKAADQRPELPEPYIRSMPESRPTGPALRRLLSAIGGFTRVYRSH
jgi:hypothetical protein